MTKIQNLFQKLEPWQFGLIVGISTTLIGVVCLSLSSSLNNKNNPATEVPSIENHTRSSSPSPTPNILVGDLPHQVGRAELSPEEFVKQYYQNINNGNYQAAWDSLPIELQNDKFLHPNGYLSFTDWWGKTVKRIELQKVDVVSKTTQEAVVETYEKYLMSNRNITTHRLRYFLGKNSNNNGWQINKITFAEQDRNRFSSKISPNRFAAFPKPSCGDPLPENPQAYPVNFYPVFIDYSENNLSVVKARFCGDALKKTREKTGKLAIQVSSFTSMDRAEAFKNLMKEKFGSGEVGEPTVVKKSKN